MTDATGTVFIVDDDQSVRRSLTRLLRGFGLTTEEFGSAMEFLQSLPAEVPACAVLDLAMPGMDGLQLQTELANSSPALRVIFLTGHGDIPASVTAMRQGATDFLTKPVDEDVLVSAISNALAASKDLATRLERFATLSPRELEVMHHVVGGRRNKQIAVDMGIGEKTVKAHRGALMAKTQSDSVAQLVQLCISANMLGD